MTLEEKAKRYREDFVCSTTKYIGQENYEYIEKAYLAGAEEVKADCDFVLEGKDVEIMELKEIIKSLLKLVDPIYKECEEHYKMFEQAEQCLKE